MLFIKHALPLLLSCVPFVLSVALPDPFPACHQPTVIDEKWIGKDKDVKVQMVQCVDIDGINLTPSSSLEKRQANVCGANCVTNCFLPSGGGPDPNECHVISDALLYDSQNVGALFNLDPATNTSLVTMQYRSCKSFMVNQAGTALQYCRTDWAAVLDWVAFNCQSTQNAHGGNCVANDQRWFIQVQSA
ncbi:hypothetical protein C8Q75DRAFT_60313 [Abortiporus biennis]|nr:hypothetical protein C8Q75DRAFT_60313 [Abortiporus biennis]